MLQIKPFRLLTHVQHRVTARRDKNKVVSCSHTWILSLWEGIFYFMTYSSHWLNIFKLICSVKLHLFMEKKSLHDNKLAWIWFYTVASCGLWTSESANSALSLLQSSCCLTCSLGEPERCSVLAYHQTSLRYIAKSQVLTLIDNSAMNVWTRCGFPGRRGGGTCTRRVLSP